jgi:hypothetical protein
MKIISEQSAKELGYEQLTHGCRIPAEAWILANIVRDLERGGIDFIAVDGKAEDGSPGVEIWRRNLKKD